MDGMIHEKVDLKVLILYIMSRLPAPVYPETVFEICICDNGVEYFDFTECFYELLESEHIREQDDEYVITSKGRNNAQILETSLPYSVRRAADRLIAPEAERLERLKMITADFESDGSSCTGHFALSDGVGQILKLDILCSDSSQAKKMKKNFRRCAEQYYISIINMLENGLEDKK